MVRDFLVLGGGSAGLIAALTLKRVLTGATVRVVRSTEIGVIGVGESTTPNVPFHFFEYLGLNRKRFYATCQPTWKCGVHFLWGSRPSFEYPFELQLDVRHPELPRPWGYYCQKDFSHLVLQASLVSQGKAFVRQPNGAPNIPATAAFHLDNPRLVKTLEMFAREAGIEFIDARVQGAEKGPAGIAAIILEDGRRLAAEFFVDASGFRSELLGKAMAEPYISYSPSLFNDRALVANWPRTNEPILPYTTAETMDAGWCWRIDHEEAINRGYVYSSAAITEEQARAEMQRKNPRAVLADHLVKFKSGRYQRAWVDNVMAIGNASGFVEPLESSALMVTCWQCQTFVELYKHAGDSPPIRKLFNTSWANTWDEIRDFLTLHFYANTRLDTPYWQHCRGDADISRLQDLLDFYHEVGPTGYARYLLKNTGSQYGIEGFLVMLVGCQVPYRNIHTPTEAELQIVQRHRATVQQLASNGLTVKEALAYVKHPNWRWFGDKE